MWEYMKEPLAMLIEATLMGLAGYLIMVGTRLTKLESAVGFKEGEEHQIGDHEKRLFLLEALVSKFGELAPALRETAAKMETLLGVAMKRLDILEDRSFHGK